MEFDGKLTEDRSLQVQVASEIGFRPLFLKKKKIISLLYLAAYVSAMQRPLYTIQGS
jgi:hypothetical protein